MVCYPQGEPVQCPVGKIAALAMGYGNGQPKTMPMEDLNSVRGRVLALYTEFGEMTDAACHGRYEVRWGRILRSSIIARRVELVRDGYLDDTGHTISGDDAERPVQCTLWGLSKDIPADVRLLNRLKRSTPREALDFALDHVSPTDRYIFLLEWRNKNWEKIRLAWPSFALPH
jgi:hypothetical protein